ncbi:MAG: hypothetical protein HGB14_01635 [Anaerolineaceae bacterium]|nr:hypothetical protein [Anaerolineaceae bacterium]
MKRLAWLVLLIPIGLYLPKINYFAFPVFSKYSDLLITHWPNANYIYQSIFLHHQIPLWNNSILAGYPFFANPLSGLWYIPGWLANFAPTPTSFNLLFLAHIFAGSLGIYLILRDEGFPAEIALTGGIAFELMPKLWAHFFQGHITLVYAVCLTPWLLFVTRRAFLSRQKNINLYIPAFFIAGIIIADPRWIPYALIIWIAFITNLLFVDPVLTNHRFQKGVIFCISHLAVGLLLSAVLMLPMIQYTQLSTRSLLTLEDNLAFSLPLLNIPLMVFPSVGITAEWFFYLGGLGFISVLLCISNPKIRTRSVVWLVLFLLGIFLAVSGSIPAISHIWGLPGLSLVRVPSRALFMSGIAVCFLIPMAIQSLFTHKINQKTTNLILAASGAFGLIALMITYFTDMSFKYPGIIHGSISLVIFSLIFFVFLNNKLGINWVWLIVGVLLLDYYLVNSRSVRFVSTTEAFKPGYSFVDQINSNGSGYQRIFTPSDSISQQRARLSGIEMVNGIDPMQLRALHEFLPFKTSSGKGEEGYSVTFPPFRTGNPESDNIDMILDTSNLGLLNVKYIISAFPLTINTIKQVADTFEGYIYENLEFRPRAWIQNIDDPLGENILQTPEISISLNRIKLFTNQKGLLVLSEINYPGWNAFIDGEAVEIFPQAGLFQSILVPGDKHEVEFVFRPEILWLGMTITIITFAGIMLFIILELRKPHDRP